MALDFTLKKYKELCRLLLKAGIQTSSVQEYLKSEVRNEVVLILRHDVDRYPKAALRMAEIERKYNITSSYYFRMKKGVFIPSVIEYIKKLGHEIGYHYEVVDKAKGNLEKAIGIFTEELQEFRKFYDVKTIAMHGNPLSKWDNRAIWTKYDFRDYGIIGEAYLSIDYSKVIYLSDTGRTWMPGKYKIKDFIPSRFVAQAFSLDIASTIELMDFLRKNNRDICLLVHPNRWSANWYEYIYQLVFDMMGNQIKKLFLKSESHENLN